MSSTQSERATQSDAGELDASLEDLRRGIEQAAHLLPAQGPITVFIHHNTLHALENLPFSDAVRQGARLFGCQPYLPEGRYRDELNRGRIRFSELQEVLAEEMGEKAALSLGPLGSCLDLRLAMMQYPLHSGPTSELQWYVAEARALRRVRREVSSATRARLIAETRRWVMRDLRSRDGTSQPRAKPRSRQSPGDGLSELLDRFGEAVIESWSDQAWESFTLQALWRVCCEGVRELPHHTVQPAALVRHADLLREATGVESDALTHGRLIPFCAAFLDQGLATWQLPGKGDGFFRAFCSLYRRPLGPPDSWIRGLRRVLARYENEKISPLASIAESLADLGVLAAERPAFFSHSLLALRGWAGMIRQVEQRGDRVVSPIPAGSLVEFLAVRLLLDRFALAHVAREALGYHGPLSALRGVARACLDRAWPPSVEQRAFLVFQLAQVLGWSPDVLHRMDKEQWNLLLREIEGFSGIERRTVFHLAYERRFYRQALDALAAHTRRAKDDDPPPAFEAVFCIDEREESVRRHLEEIAPQARTYGTAGFFSVPMYYRGADDAHYVPLCPPAMRPRHWVTERRLSAPGATLDTRRHRRRAFGAASHQFQIGSRSFALGALLTTGVGVLASVPLIARTLSPRLTDRLMGRVRQIVQRPEPTRLQLERAADAKGPEEARVGFTIEEMTDIAEQLLREIGLTDRFCRIVLFIGHGSRSMNNPHESAHDCGACGGARGGPNARALAQFLNSPNVRGRLAERGLQIPAETVFIGGMHNTSTDDLALYDLDLVPGSHAAELELIQELLEQACDRDAHERSRRFESAPLTQSFTDAREHVQARAADLAQVRPEWGHATNALCFVGRRERTRGLFLDRRAFLASYDPMQDDEEQSILARIVNAVLPVCAGINLEYYFSSVDNAGWGCGTKLPHNITALLGVMDGAMSDLRTGLPLQMVEIHEPVRLLFIVESTAGKMLRLLKDNEGFLKLCDHRWVQLAVLDPHTLQASLYRGGRFHAFHPDATALPHAASSVEWYRGWRDHLEFAEIDMGRTREPAARGRDRDA
jgi:uncharacterized protein YbcC (UPF0753/DUF2309 family)